MDGWQGKRVLVAGLGGTGLSVIEFLGGKGARVEAYDAVAANPPQGVPCYSGSLKDALVRGFDVLVLSPGIDSRLAEIAAFRQGGGEVLGDVEILARELKGRRDRVIAITGSNGKTTVTHLVGHLCRESGLDTVMAGNVGVPVLSALMRRNEESADVWVLELSSFQLESTSSLNADAATVLNVSEDHLDRYEDLLDYARTKDRVFQGAGVQVLNADDAICRAMKRAGRDVRWFSLAGETDYCLDGAGRLKAEGRDLLATSEMPLQGLHNAANVLAALALCEAIGLKAEDLLPHVRSFKGLPHRVEKIGEKNGVVFIDDSKGTNVGATAAAIAGLQRPLVLIAGGQGKGQDFTPLNAALKDKVRAVVLIGQDAPKIRRDLAESGSVRLVDCATMDEAVRTAYAIARPGDAVLLSPACASFDMFKGYAHRAQVFAEAFAAL